MCFIKSPQKIAEKHLFFPREFPRDFDMSMKIRYEAIIRHEILTFAPSRKQKERNNRDMLNSAHILLTPKKTERFLNPKKSQYN
jgi:hypothetical protein